MMSIREEEKRKCIESKNLGMTAVLSMTALVAALSAGSVLAQETPKRGGLSGLRQPFGPGYARSADGREHGGSGSDPPSVRRLGGHGRQVWHEPMLAKNVAVSEDGKTYTFVLREGVKFHNGKVMTSEDVKATFERYARISPNKAALKDVVAYETPDPIRSSSGSRDQCGVPGCVETPVYPFVILPADQREKAPRDIDVVGTGPFMLSEWRKDSHLIIKRFVGYVADEKSSGPMALPASERYTSMRCAQFCP